MITDWKAEIVKGDAIHQRIEELDRGRLWQRHLPEVAASEEEISSAEAALGFRLEERYRTFLRHANGWKSFYQAVDLFGTANLLGASPMDSARRQLQAIEALELEAALDLNLADVLPIGASALQRDIFLIAQKWSDRPGSVVWFAGRVVDSFPTFDEFFLAMLDYNRREVSYLESDSAS